MQNLTPETFPKPNSILERQLHGLWTVVRLVAGERIDALQRGEPLAHSTYDRFLWSQVGRPDTGECGLISRRVSSGESYVYDDAVSLSYSSKGILAAVRRSTGKKSVDRNRYLVATADLRRRAITEWQVERIELNGKLGELCTSLLLNENYLHVVPNDLPTETEDVFPRFELSGQGNTFFDQFTRRHVLAPIAELCQVVDYAWPAIRQNPQVIDHETADQTIAWLNGQAA